MAFPGEPFFGLPSGRLVDLTHPLRTDMPVWPGHPVFRQTSVASFAAGDIACNHSLELSEHSGTHFDAPLHFVPGGASIDEIPLGRFFGRLLTIKAANVDPDSELSVDRLRAFEEDHGPIGQDDAVAFHFGWDIFWHEPGGSERILRDWPGLSREAAEFLAGRRVRFVATDAMSIDRFSSSDFPAHRLLLGAGVLVGENFDRLGQLPPVCNVAALPLPIAGGSGSPLRAVALVPAGES